MDADRTAALVAAWKVELTARGALLIPVGAGSVRRDEAARLVGLSPRTLKNRQQQGMAPDCRKLGGRWAYTLDELAAFVLNGRKRDDALL